MSIESDLQLIEDLDGMAKRLRRGWTRRMWVKPGFPFMSYCLTGAMNKQIVGKAGPTFAEKRITYSAENRRWQVLQELGFNNVTEAEIWNDQRTSTNGKIKVLDRISSARIRASRRVEAEQLRLAREAAAVAEVEQREREAVARGRFVQEWLDKPREEGALVVPEEWTQETAPDNVRGQVVPSPR